MNPRDLNASTLKQGESAQRAMTDTIWGACAATAVSRLGFARAADVYAALAAASLPWSTTATGILVVAWPVTLVPPLTSRWCAGRS
jgi:hypothetical protein